MDHELDELKREFLTEAGEKVTEMETALERVPEREALDRLAYLAHQLKGSGGSYGYQRISTDAAALEKIVEALVEKNDGGAEAPARIQEFVGNLRAEISRAADELN